MTLFLTPREIAQQAPLASSWRQRARIGVLSSVMAVVCWAPAVQAFSPTVPGHVEQSRAGTLPLTQLPQQGQEVYRRIFSGGPFRYGKDGVVFSNREAQLPRHRRGFYHEYTVPTPGSRDRGARRIVCGGEIVQSPETCFYTQDHYQSFQKIDPSR